LRIATIVVPLGIAAAISASSGPAQAQASAAQQSGWSFDFTPYLWGAAMEGSVGAGELPIIDIDMSFSDILDHLDAGLMGAFEARKGRWGILLDAIYMKIEDSATASRTGAGPIGATASAGALLEVRQTTYAAALAYRVTEGRAPLDVVAGVRYLRIEAEARIDGSFFAQSGSVQRSAKKSWGDPYVGLRLQQPFAERWTLAAYGDIGGFGVSSDFTWQALLGVEYEFSKAIAGKAGYRHIAVDYDQDGFAFDMAYSGLYFGLGIRF
jgi:opacity protein-like surface antigen